MPRNPILNSAVPIGYTPATGGIPNLPTAGNLSGSMRNILNQAIPGFGGLTKSASSIVGSALSGELPGDVQEQIRNAGANQAVMSGMPGSSNMAGSLFGNRNLRDLGLTSLQRQDAGFKDLLSMLQGFSGTVAPTFGQAQEQENARAQYAAAPIPSAAQAAQESIYNKYANPGGGYSAKVQKGLMANPLNFLRGAGGGASFLQQAGFNNLGRDF